MKHANIGLFVPHEGCPHTCSFCNQRSISGKTKRLTAQDVISAANNAIESGCSFENSEIAFFGGSFTAIEREYMRELLAAAYPFVKEKKIGGIRISTRPDAIDDEVLDELEAYGVTSIELGAQSMNDDVLLMNERGHTAQDVRNASGKIKEHGFELGLQMMTGLYGESGGEIKTAEELIKLKPKTVRIYPTVVLKGTRLEELFKRGEYEPQTLEDAVKLCSKLLLMFEDADINVIRLGLHSGGDVKENFVAGVYHEAFRELCESEIYFQKILKLIDDKGIEKGNIKIYTAPQELSKTIGQRKCNIEKLSRLGYRAKAEACKGCEKGKIEIE